jgi:hypothetical protein
MVLADSQQNMIDVRPNICMGGLDPCDYLQPRSREERKSGTLRYLRNNVKPGIHFDNSESSIDFLADIIVRAVFKPQRQQSKSVL